MVLGSGSYGTVREGRWGLVKVAAKIFHVSASEVAQVAIQREIKVLESLSNRYIIQFYTTVYHEGQLVVLTDLAEGGSLALAIQKGIKEWSTKERFAREMMLGLAYIHSQGVLHLDLKSHNVLLSHSMEIKLCDFGCATVKSTSATKSTDSQRGTIRWAAPEIFVPRPKYSTKTDMYSLGMVMWEMAADCTTPFRDHRDNMIVAILVMNGAREEIPKETPTEYRAWIERCWVKDPSKRPEAREYLQERRSEEQSEKEEEVKNTKLDSNGITAGQDTTNSISFSFDSPPQSVLLPLDVMSTGTSNREPLSPMLYEDYGSDTEMDASETFEWYLDCARQGLTQAQHRIGDMYANGQGTERDEQEAVKWYLLSAQNGYIESQLKLGTMFFTGKGVEQNDMKAVEWYTKAANQGNPRAQHYLGLMYRDGQGTEQSDSKAVEWFTKAANQGNSRTQHCLGAMYRNGRGVEQSDAKAVEWFTKAAIQGNASAQYDLGCLYRSGQGVEQSDVKAVEWFTKAAKRLIPKAQYELGWMYANGRGIDQSDVKAVEWFTIAANQDEPDALYELGWMYANGRGVEKSNVKAVEMYTKAAKHGNTRAEHNLTVIRRSG
ncbi:hypothetical protein BGW42_001079 [Actinomortierella wolfii]|nr:hypothetical protein BGW42_001079 [Actinomortierella wolfii]